MSGTSKRSIIGPLCLAILVFQNSAFFLATHQGRIPDKDGHTYFAPTMVALLEIFKASISFLILFYTQYRAGSPPTSPSAYSLLPRAPAADEQDEKAGEERVMERAGAAWRAMSPMIFTKTAWKLSVPATLYVMQTVLAIAGAQNLDTTTFMIASQLKFATTALCTSVMLNRVIGLRRWACLGVLAVGVAMVQLTNAQPAASTSVKGAERSPVIGIISIILACFISGFASVFLEKILKNGSTNLWATNIQLGAFSLPPALLPMMLDSWRNGLYHPFMHFGFWAWATVLANVAGGLIVALVIKYADNIQKSLAISAAIVLTFFISLWLGKAEYSASAMAGSALVIGSIIAYSRFGETKKPSPPDSVGGPDMKSSSLEHVSVEAPQRR